MPGGIWGGMCGMCDGGGGGGDGSGGIMNGNCIPGGIGHGGIPPIRGLIIFDMLKSIDASASASRDSIGARAGVGVAATFGVPLEGLDLEFFLLVAGASCEAGAGIIVRSGAIVEEPPGLCRGGDVVCCSAVPPLGGAACSWTSP
jgi:hypothetical protein